MTGWVVQDDVGVRGRGVQNGQIAHRHGVSGTAVCKMGESHTVTGVREPRCAKWPDRTPGRGFGALRCAKGPDRTPGRGFGPCGVQKGRIAHRDGISGIAACIAWEWRRKKQASRGARVRPAILHRLGRVRPRLSCIAWEWCVRGYPASLGNSGAKNRNIRGAGLFHVFG